MRRALVVVLALVATACGAFTDDPYYDSSVGQVAVSPDNRVLQVHILSCARYHLDVEESPTEVRLASRAYDDDGDCAGLDAEVRLEAPLGDRTVIDVHDDGQPVRVVDCARHRRAPVCVDLG